MIKRVFIFVAFLSLFSKVSAQKDTYDQLKTQYDSLRKAENYERALLVAKQMNTWALQNETDTSLRYAVSLRYVGVCFSYLQELDSAKTYYQFSLEALKLQNREDHPDYAKSLNNLGVLYHDMGDYHLAMTFLEKYKNICEKEYGKDWRQRREYDYALNIVGKLYEELGDYEKAELHYNDLLKMRIEVYGELFTGVTNVYILLARLHIKKNDYSNAEVLYLKSIVNSKLLFGPEHPRVKSIENEMAFSVFTRTKKFVNAFEILVLNAPNKSKEIALNFEIMSDVEKEAYWKKESGFYDDLSWFASKAYTKVPEAVALNYKGALITKSKLLETKIRKENYYIEVDEIREELSYRKKLLNKLESDGSDKKELMDKLRHEADSLDKQLELSWPAYAEQKRNLLITWDKVHQNLSDGEAAIEFVRFREDEDSAYQYQALIIRKDLELPVLAPLCFEKDLLAINPKSGFSAYYPLVWEPMEEHLKDIHTIYYAPSGELYNVPFHAIYAPQGNGDELVEAKTNKRGIVIVAEHAKTEEKSSFLMDRYTLHQLTSTRSLALGLKKKEQEQPEASIAVVGGVNYDYLPGQETAKPKKGKATDRSSASANGKLSYLEGTKQEAEAIHKTVETKSWNTTYLEGNNAKEENITKLTDKEAKGILHIATHGYAFPEYSSLDTTNKENSLRYSYRFSQNPMVRSGLILARGNWAWTGSDTLSKLGAEQNGILTALEVSQLSLKKTKLVVLSACETGLGKIEGSEGTFGLKRGFKLAGVEQMIVSLWSVPDKETMELMTLFYSDLTKTLNPVTSFEKAQKEMRAKYPTDPEKWAGFVLVR